MYYLKYVATLRLSHIRSLLIALAILIAWAAVLYYVPAGAIIAVIGVSNAYAVSFLVSLLAGFSAFTGTAAYATVIEFSRGGADPLYLGVLSGIGLFLSDTLFYLLLMQGRESLETRWPKALDRLHDFVERIPPVTVYIGIYLFCAFGPIPNDLILAALMLGGYEYRKFWPMLLAGDITFMLFLSYLFQQ